MAGSCAVLVTFAKQQESERFVGSDRMARALCLKTIAAATPPLHGNLVLRAGHLEGRNENKAERQSLRVWYGFRYIEERHIKQKDLLSRNKKNCRTQANKCTVVSPGEALQT
ncbi:UNVERIFIED_CONTAM: hypothetical protein K2H54_043941, partial [Gekko kuhli]